MQVIKQNGNIRSFTAFYSTNIMTGHWFGFW